MVNGTRTAMESRSRPSTCSNKKPTRMVAANRTGMAGADPLLIAPGLKRKLGLWSKRRTGHFVLGSK